MKQKEIFRKVINGILNQNLEMKKSERYLFYTDSNSTWEENLQIMIKRREFLHSFYETFHEFIKDFPNALHDKYESTELHGAEPRVNIWKLAFGDKMYLKLLNLLMILN